MEDFLSSHVQNGYQFNIPSGLKELMSDISREVLRAQPSDIYHFVTSYLSALLITREHLNIASFICDCVLEKDLEQALTDIGLKDDDVIIAVKIITRYFNEEPKVKEIQLLNLLTSKLKIEEDQIALIQEALQTAFLRHKNHSSDIAKELQSVSSVDKINQAVDHTLALYAQSEPTEEEFYQMAVKIQSAYRTYDVKRKCFSQTISQQEWDDTKNYMLNKSFSEQSVSFSSAVSNKNHPLESASKYSFLAYKLKCSKKDQNCSNDETDDLPNISGRRRTIGFITNLSTNAKDDHPNTENEHDKSNPELNVQTKIQSTLSCNLYDDDPIDIEGY